MGESSGVYCTQNPRIQIRTYVRSGIGNLGTQIQNCDTDDGGHNETVMEAMAVVTGTVLECW